MMHSIQRLDDSDYASKIMRYLLHSSNLNYNQYGRNLTKYSFFTN